MSEQMTNQDIVLGIGGGGTTTPHLEISDKTIQLYDNLDDANMDFGRCLKVIGPKGEIYYAPTVNPDLVTNKERIQILANDAKGDLAILDDSVKTVDFSTTATYYDDIEVEYGPAPLGIFVQLWGSKGDDGDNGTWGSRQQVWCSTGSQSWQGYYEWVNYYGSDGQGGHTGIATIISNDIDTYIAPCGGAGGNGGYLEVDLKDVTLLTAPINLNLSFIDASVNSGKDGGTNEYVGYAGIDGNSGAGSSGGIGGEQQYWGDSIPHLETSARISLSKYEI